MVVVTVLKQWSCLHHWYSYTEYATLVSRVTRDWIDIRSRCLQVATWRM